jgi:hypothetical protein
LTGFGPTLLWRSGSRQDERTKDAPAAKEAAGVRLGRPTSIPASVSSQIVELRAAGLTLRSIVERLALEGVPTVSGGGWQISTVRARRA